MWDKMRESCGKSCGSHVVRVMWGLIRYPQLGFLDIEGVERGRLVKAQGTRAELGLLRSLLKVLLGVSEKTKPCPKKPHKALFPKAPSISC